jgi:DNA-binding GntR family transcriptional regulator
MAKRTFIVDTGQAAGGENQLALGAETDPSRTLIERAYTQLRTDIIEGRLLPDEKLRVEHLKSRYGVSAGTLREAMSRLVSDALILAEGQRGFRVAPLTLEDLEDLTHLRVKIEIDALRKSIRLGDAQWRENLRQVYEELSLIEQPLLPHQAKQWDRLNARFHEVLVEASASPWTMKLLKLLSRHGERYRRCSIELNDHTRDVHAEHRDIFVHAMEGNELRAALALEAHIRSTPELIKSALNHGVNVFRTVEPAARDPQSGKARLNGNGHQQPKQARRSRQALREH